VCRERPRATGRAFLCASCGKSYDKAVAKDATILGAILFGQASPRG
jgi:hypothetical protein